ncbi:MAG: DUF1365 family protein [Desulfonatronovibrionaceae bacterium]
MNSRIVPVLVSHERKAPVRHGFEYPYTCLILDLDELQESSPLSRLFKVNALSLFSIAEDDYLPGWSGSLRQKLAHFMHQKAGMKIQPESRVFLLTPPRLWGRVFAPVSFYFVYAPSGQLDCVAAEVNNTFGDKHVYMLKVPEDQKKYPVRLETDKDFHVSPFFPMAGRYCFLFSDIREKLDIKIQLIQDDTVVLEAGLKQKHAPAELNTRNILLCWMAHPLTPVLTYQRILSQAARLYFRHRLRVHPRPEPESPMTIMAAEDIPGIMLKTAMNIVRKNLSRIQAGRLRLILPDGSVMEFRGQRPGPEGIIQVHDLDFFIKLVRSEDIGFGEAYTQGLWSSDDPAGVLELLAMNMHHMSWKEDWGLPGRLLHKSSLLARKMIPANTVQGCRKNIRAHYDLSNDLFAAFLDQGLNYSCAVFDDPLAEDAETLEQAQNRKLSMAAGSLELTPEDHVLDLGCGWGGFTFFAAGKLGCRVTGVTVSRRQYDYVREKIRTLGLEDQVRVLLEDYRTVQGVYDKIVSIEMLEAVGHKYHPDFFGALDRLLKPGGMALVQTITIADQRYEIYRRTRDWISTYIFPGGLLPSLTRISEVLAAETSLVISGVKDIGIHYPRTLGMWLRNFKTNEDLVRNLGFDREFMRKWEYYFCLCQAGFRTRHIRDLQILMDRPVYCGQ